jgi:hypothetical protein
MKTLSPYANESESFGLGDLTVENRTDRVSIYGSIDLTRDKEGLAHAQTLKSLLEKVIQVLEADRHLPDKLPPPEPPDAVKNPFA